MSTNAFPLSGSFLNQYRDANMSEDEFYQNIQGKKKNPYSGTFRPGAYGNIYGPGNPGRLPYGPKDTLVGRLGGLTNLFELQRQGEYGSLQPEFQSLVSDPGYSEEERSRIMQESLGGAEAGIGAMRDRAMNRLARTRNTAGYGSFLRGLEQEGVRTKAGLTRQNLINFADEKFRRKMAGLEGLMQLYGINTSFLNDLLRQGTSIQGIRESKKRSLFDRALETAKTGASIYSSIAGG